MLLCVCEGVWAHGDFCLINPNTGGIWMLGRRSEQTLIDSLLPVLIISLTCIVIHYYISLTCIDIRVAGLTVWNSLPLDIQNPSLATEQF